MTADDAAKWMAEELKKKKFLYQDTVVYDLQKLDPAFVYINANGNLAIAQDVLKPWKKLMADDVVWSRSDRCWRFRQPYDKPGRMQY